MSSESREGNETEITLNLHKVITIVSLILKKLKTTNKQIARVAASKSSTDKVPPGSATSVLFI